MQKLDNHINQADNLEQEQELNVLYDSLLVALKNELTVYRELKEIVASERDVLRRHSVDELMENNSRKETVILKVKMLEEVKQNIIRRIANVLGIYEGKAKLTTLIPYADNDRKRLLKACHMKLRSMTDEIQKKNRNNMELMSLSLKSVVGSINFINNLLFSGETYEDTGKMASVNSQGRLLKVEG